MGCIGGNATVLGDCVGGDIGMGNVWLALLSCKTPHGVPALDYAP